MARRAPRRRASDISRRQKRSLQQLLMTALALAMLLLFWGQLSQGAAGCFTMMSGPQEPGVAPGAARPTGDADAVGDQPRQPEDQPAPAIRVQVPDASSR